MPARLHRPRGCRRRRDAAVTAPDMIRAASTEDDLATRAALALIECQALAAEAETARARAAEARDAAAAALHDAGWTFRRIGAELGVSHTLAHRMVKAHRDRTWGGFQAGYSATPSLAQLADEYRLARHAQELRAEAAGAAIPGSDERAAFFGAEHVAQRDSSESPLVWGSWMQHRSAMLRDETA